MPSALAAVAPAGWAATRRRARGRRRERERAGARRAGDVSWPRSASAGRPSGSGPTRAAALPVRCVAAAADLDRSRRVPSPRSNNGRNKSRSYGCLHGRRGACAGPVIRSGWPTSATMACPGCSSSPTTPSRRCRPTASKTGSRRGAPETGARRAPPCARRAAPSRTALARSSTTTACLHHRDAWVSLSPVEQSLAPALLDRFGAVVHARRAGRPAPGPTACRRATRSTCTCCGCAGGSRRSVSRSAPSGRGATRCKPRRRDRRTAAGTGFAASDALLR